MLSALFAIFFLRLRPGLRPLAKRRRPVPRHALPAHQGRASNVALAVHSQCSPLGHVHTQRCCVTIIVWGTTTLPICCMCVMGRTRDSAVALGAYCRTCAAHCRASRLYRAKAARTSTKTMAPSGLNTQSRTLSILQPQPPQYRLALFSAPGDEIGPAAAQGHFLPRPLLGRLRSGP